MKSFLDSRLLLRLEENPLLSLNIKGFFCRFKVENVIEINSSFMVSGKSDELWCYVYCNSTKDFSRILEKMGVGEHHFAVLSDWMLDEVKSNFEVQWLLSCKRFYLPKQINLPKLDLMLTELSPSDTDCIFSNSNYKSFTSPEYISNQLKANPGIAYRHGQALAGWAMFHDDGALGLLHVLDDYRRQGIAKSLVVGLCKRLRRKNQIPYTSIEPSNFASLQMIRSLGFIELDNVHWCKVVSKERGMPG